MNQPENSRIDVGGVLGFSSLKTMFASHRGDQDYLAGVQRKYLEQSLTACLCLKGLQTCIASIMRVCRSVYACNHDFAQVRLGLTAEAAQLISESSSLSL